MKGREGRHALRGGCLAKLFVLFVFVGAGLALAWMLFLPVIFTGQLRRQTGFDAEVTSFAVNPLSGRVVMRGLVISNPPTFPVKDGLHVTTFEANSEVGSYFGNKWIIDDLTLDVAKVTLVKRKDGHTNLEIFQQNLAGPVPLPPSAKSQVFVHKLRLKVDALSLADHSERVPRVKEYKLGFDQTFENVSDPKQLLAAPNVWRVLVSSGAAGDLGGFLSGDLSKQLNESLRGGNSQAKPAGGAVPENFRGFLDKLEELRKP